MDGPEPLIGATIAGYRIEAAVGSGGMGSVYRATQMKLGRPVALKLIAPQWADDPEFRERFRREASVAASIEHPHAVPVYEADEVDGRLFIAMRFVDGVDLATMIRDRERLEPSLAVRLVAQVAAALDVAHEHGLIHRDVKPRNILVAGRPGDEHAYLTDFGIAKDFAAGSDLTRTGQIMGTLDYAAPEQLRGGGLDGRTDVYALGCVLYQALTGRAPFARDTEAATVAAHLLDPPPSVRADRPEIPVELDAVVGRALAKPVEDRYATAGDLGRAASAALAGATRPRRTERAPRRRWPPRAIVLALLAAAAAAVAGALVLFTGGDDGGAERQQPAAGPARVAATVPVGQEPFAVAALPTAVLVADFDAGGEIKRIDPGTNEVVGAPVRLAGIRDLGVAGERAWAFDVGAVRSVDADGRVGDPIRVGGETDIVWAVAGDRRSLWVALSAIADPTKRESSSIVQVDLRTSEVARRVRIAGPGEPFPVAMAVGAGAVWAVQMGERRLSAIPIAGGRPARSVIRLPDRPSGVAAADDAVWVTLGPSVDVRYANTVIRVDPGRREVVGEPIPVFRGPIQPVLVGEDLWLLSPVEGAVGRVDTAGGRMVGSPLPVGEEPSALSYGAGALWVADRAGDVVTRVAP